VRFHVVVMDAETGPSARVTAGSAAADVELVAQVAGGDRGAPLEELYRRYAGRLYGIGLRLLGDPGLAEELVQESFVRLWRTAGRYDPARGSVAGFLCVLARHIAVDLWRRPSSRPLGPAPSDGRRADEGPDEGGPGLDNLDALLETMVVQDALDALTPAHRQVLELSYGGGLTQSEIARRIGVPLGTVKTRSYYALRALKLALEERGVDA